MNSEGRQSGFTILGRLAPLLGTAVLYGLVGMMMSTVLAVDMDRQGASRVLVGAMFASSALAFLIFPPLWGAVSDILGKPRRIMALALLLATLMIPFFIMVTDPRGSVALRFLFVVFASGFVPPVLAQTSAIGGSAQRGYALGFLNSAMGLGRGTGQICAGLFLGLLAREWTFAIMGVIGILAFCLLALFKPAPAPVRTLSLREQAAEVWRRLVPRVGGMDHLKRYGLIWVFVAFSLRDITILGSWAMMPIYAIREVGLTEWEMGLLLSLNPLCQVFFQPFFGRLADSVGRKRLIVWGMLGSAGVPILFSFASHPWVIVMGMVLVALVFSSLYSGTTAFIGDAAPEGRVAELMGLHVTFRGIGGAIGPILVGYLASPGVWGFQRAFLSISILAFIGSLLVVFFVEETLQTTRPGSS